MLPTVEGLHAPHRRQANEAASTFLALRHPDAQTRGWPSAW